MENEGKNHHWISEFAPLIGFWVSKEIEKKLVLYNTNLTSIINHAPFNSCMDNQIPCFRVLDLKHPTEPVSNHNIENSASILEEMSKPFEWIEYVTNFSLDLNQNTMNYFNKDKYTFDDFKKEATPWYKLLQKKALYSPHLPVTSLFDMPSCIISFSMNDEKLPVLKYLPNKWQDELSYEMDILHIKIIVSFKDEEMIFSSETLPNDVHISLLNLESNPEYFKWFPFYTNETNLTQAYIEILLLLQEIIRYSQEVVVKSVIKTRIKNYISKLENINKKGSIFSFRKKGDDIQKNELLIMTSLCYIVLNDFTNSKLLLEDLSQSQNNEYEWEQGFLKLHIMIEEGCDLSELFSEFFELIQKPKSIDYAPYLLFFMTDAICRQSEITEELDHAVWHFFKSSFWQSNSTCKLLRIFCLENISRHYLNINKPRKAIFYMYNILLLLKQYENMHGHALRCATFLNYFFCRDDDPENTFICGKNNLEKLYSCETHNIVNWERLVYYSLKSVASHLKHCKKTSYLPLFYMNLFTRTEGTRSQNNQTKLMIEFFHSINLQFDPETCPTIELPFIKVLPKTKIYTYGMPEFFGLDQDGFIDMIDFWTRSTLSTDNITTHWGLNSSNDDPIYIGCNEKVKFRLSIIRPQVAVPFQLSDVHFITKEIPDISLLNKQNYIQPSFVKTISYLSNIEKRSTEIPTTAYDEEESFCKMSRKTVLVRNNVEIIKSSLIPTKPKVFQIPKLSFIFWNTSNIVVPINTYTFCAIEKHPTLSIKFVDFPELLHPYEIHKFKIIASNVGDAPLSTLLLINRANNVLSFNDEWIIKEGYKIHGITNEIRNGEEIEFEGYLKMNEKEIGLDLLFVYDSMSPLGWRFFPVKKKIRIKKREIINYEIKYDPRDTFNYVLFVDVECKASQVTITSAIIKNDTYLPIEDNVECESYQKKCYILQKSTTSVPIHKYSKDFFDNKQQGILFYKVDNAIHSEMPIYLDSCFDLKFKIESPVKICFPKNKKFVSIPVKLIIENKGAEMKCVTIQGKPFQGGNPNWMGVCKYIEPVIQSDQTITFNFKIVSLKPGIFNVANFEIKCDKHVTEIPFTRHVIIQSG